MKKDEIENLRGRNLTVGRFTFLFTRKPVKTQADVTERKNIIARLHQETKPMRDAAKIADAIEASIEKDIGYYFALEAANKLKEPGVEKQGELFTLGEIVEQPINSRPKKTPTEKPGKAGKPAAKKTASKKSDKAA